MSSSDEWGGGYKEEEQWQRATKEWAGTRGDSQFITRGEFYARWNPMQPKLDFLYDKIVDIENRLPTELAKDWGRDLLASLWGKLVVVVLAVITAFLASHFVGYGVHLPDWVPLG